MQRNVSELWNEATLEPPPTLTCVYSQKFDIRPLLQVFEDITSTLNSQAPLRHETALLDRLIYKFDKKFRHDIGFKSLKKVSTALHRFSKINLMAHTSLMTSLLSENSDENFIPSKQMFEYELVRLQSYAKLLERVLICSKKSAIFYMDRIKRGEALWMSFIPYSIISRIWSISNISLKTTGIWYNKLLPYLKFFQYRGSLLLPPGYEFPKDLEYWIDRASNEEQCKFSWTKKKSEPLTFFLENEDCDKFDLEKYVEQLNNSMPDEHAPLIAIQEVVKNPVLIASKQILSHDIGEKVQRQKYHPVEIIPKGTKSCSNHLFEAVKDSKSLKEFIGKEERLRLNKNKTSLTHHLSLMQWQALKVNLQRIADAEFKPNKFLRKIQKVWLQKCIDYL